MADARFLASLVESLWEKRDSEGRLASRLTNSTAQAFGDFCSSLKPHEPYPCPLCFIARGRISNLLCSNAANGDKCLKCLVCLEQFSFPGD